MKYEQLMQELDSKTHRLSFYPLMKFAESPREFIRYRTKERDPMTDDMKLGQLFENFALTDELGGVSIDTEDGREQADFVIFDDSDMIEELSKSYKNPRATKDYKTWKKETLDGIHPDQIVTQDMVETAKNMAKRLHTQAFFKFYLQDRIKEVGKEVNWERHGVKMKGYVDACGLDVADLKKIKDAKFRKARWTIQDRNYPMQIAMYADALGVSTGYIICADITGEICIVKYPDLSPYINRYLYFLEKFVECCEHKRWNEGQEFWNDDGYFLID